MDRIRSLLESTPTVSLDRAVSEVPNTPGLYAIHVDSTQSLPSTFANELRSRGTKLLYVGMASRDLRKRLVRQDLKGEGASTFFRGIGAVLDFRPPPGSLRGKKNQNNYRFSGADRQQIVEWINLHICIRWYECNEPCNLATIEKYLIEQLGPLLNTRDNPRSFPQLKKLREECRNIARAG